MTHVSLFSGVGGFDIAAEWAGFETVLFCEKDPYCQKVLARHWPGVPIIDDIRSVNRESISGAVDVISGGPPCQPASVAGKRRGKSDDRWLWPEVMRVVRELRPAWVFAENPTGILSMAEFPELPDVEDWIRAGGNLGDVYTRTGRGYTDDLLEEVESLGYKAVPVVISAASVGAPHLRKRVFILAHREDIGHVQPGIDGRDSAETGRSACPGGICADVADAEECGRGEWNKDAGGRGAGTGKAEERVRPSLGSWRAAKRGLGGMADEFPGWLDEPAGIPRVSTGDKNRVNRLKALGNAVVPAQAYPIFRAIAQVEKGEKP